MNPPRDMFPSEDDVEETDAAALAAAGQEALFDPPSDAQKPAPPPSPAPASADKSVDKKPDGSERAQHVPAAQSQPASEQRYRVLARKYRPQTFTQLIGQEPMVRTLANAIARDRLAHAFLMTGVRGVGKTSTARLIAKALNCIGPDGEGGPTIDPCGVCEPCRAIAEGRHIDVIEMDAASHNGIDDVRAMTDAVRYAAVSARYKIYIIDEVHMMSKPAFNALLKTLEEPPGHVKFLFATTEVEKLPVTVLSRTQRFDLRRVSRELLEQHYASICRVEGVDAEPEALALIAAAAEGSVRDGLSILDQAIAHADLEDAGGQGGDARPVVTARRVREMLGLADRNAERALFASLIEADPDAMLDAVEQQYALGVEPAMLLRAMMQHAHLIALAQLGRGAADAGPTEADEALARWVGAISPAEVHRLWQLLLKGYEEVRAAPDPLVAAQMALLRVLHAADLPDPGQLARQLAQLSANGIPAAGLGALADPAAPDSSGSAHDWRSLVARIDEDGAMHLASKLRMQVRVIELAPGRLVYRTEPGFDEDLCPALRSALRKLTDRRWQVERGAGEGAPTLAAQDAQVRHDEARSIRENPLVEAALAAFPDAELLDEDAGDPVRRNQNVSR